MIGVPFGQLMPLGLAPQAVRQQGSTVNAGHPFGVSTDCGWLLMQKLVVQVDCACAGLASARPIAIAISATVFLESTPNPPWLMPLSSLVGAVVESTGACADDITSPGGSEPCR